jgi:ATP-binding cassette subfamily F protein 3
MPIVTVSQLGKSFGAERIFSGISFQIDPQDRIGLVGPNGAGKSTLLNILAGREEPDEGVLAIGRYVRVGYLTQVANFQMHQSLHDELISVFAELREWEEELQALGHEMAEPAVQNDPELHERLLARYADLQARYEHAGGYTHENRVAQVLDGLGFSREQQLAPVSHLSGGQQTRASLGKLLLQEPDLLLLDEPTNHLDLETLEWLETYLASWKGAMVIVAHDRYFLDKVVSRTIEMAFGRIEEYPGNYTRHLELREERMERRQREYEAQQAYIAHTEEFIRRYKAGQRSREARGRQKLLDRMERVARPQDLPEMHFALTPVTDSGLIVLAANKLAVGYGGIRRKGQSQPSDEPSEPAKVLVNVSELELLRGDRVGLLGPNGAGKTTLLRTMIGELQPVAGSIHVGSSVRIGYYSQTHEGLNKERTILDEIRQVSALSEEGARTFLGRFLFSGDDVFKAIGSLSGGERSRVALAKLTLQGSNCLVLDEPTNHLDLQSRQFLEEVLGEFEGTLLFVSHDRYFIDRLATKIWVVEAGGLQSYLGNYTEYRTARQRQAQNVATAEKTTRKVSETKASPAKPTNKKGGKTKVRTVEDVERDVEKAEAYVQELEEAVSQAALKADGAQLTQLAADYEQARARVEALMEEWERLSEVAS